MSKIIKEKLEYVSLSDAVQANPQPGGYSAPLPSPPGVTPISTSGISVTDSYLSDTVLSAGNSYGLIVVNVASAVSTVINLPKNANFRVYNTGSNRLAITPTTWTTTSPYSVNPPVVACPPGIIVGYPQTMNQVTSLTGAYQSFTQYTLYIVNAAAPLVGPIASTPAAITAQIFFFQDVPSAD